MFNRSFVSLRRAALALALSACASLASAASTYQVQIDTASLVSTYGNTGWIDLQFNPGNSGTPFAQAVLTGFTGFGDASSVEFAGSAGGSLASGYTLANDGADGYNDIFHAVNFGATVGFTVTFSGDIDPLSGLGSAFAVSLFNQGVDTVLGTNDPSGALVVLNWSPQGSITATALDTTIATSVTAIAPVPEPETWLMLGAGLALVGGLARRRKALAA